METLVKSAGGWKIWPRPEQSRYLQELKPYLVASVVLIATGIALGTMVAVYVPKITHLLREPLAEFAQMLLGLPKLYLALAIFFNNALKVLMVIVVGILWGVLPVIFLLGNGMVIGIVVYFSIQSQGALATLLVILPHGLFELPAVLVGASMGLMLGAHATRRLLGKPGTAIGSELGRALRVFLVIIVPLLLVAAFIETFLSPYFISR